MNDRSLFYSFTLQSEASCPFKVRGHMPITAESRGAEGAAAPPGV